MARITNLGRNPIDTGVIDLATLGDKNERKIRVIFGSSDDKLTIGAVPFVQLSGRKVSDEEARQLKEGVFTPTVEIPDDIWKMLRKVPFVEHFVSRQTLVQAI